MRGKFAKVRLAKTMDEIDWNNNFLKRAPRFIQNWYIDKYMPMVIEEVSIYGALGYEIILSRIDEEFILNFAEEAKYLGVRAMFSEEEIPLPRGFFVPDGVVVKVFLLDCIIDKILRAVKIEPSKLSLIIIEGEEPFTKAVVELLYPRLNHLGIILESGGEQSYSGLAYEIFNDCGLNISFGERGSYLLKEADIIINLSENEKGYESFYKKNACYIELSSASSKINDIKLKRSDILTINKFNVEYEGEILPIEQFELFMYLELAAFYNFVSGRNVRNNIWQIKNWIEASNIKLRNMNF
ncbi:MAG: hypothetical protein FWE24_02275 [Defluviitaleaceae bacterium]|nr:hypothetical protein [Defluviitaleaceae bacterium]